MTNDKSREAVVVAYGRSPCARAFKGGLANTHPVEYGAQTLQGVLAKLPGLDPLMIDDVICGCSGPEKFCGANIGRLIAQRAGLPDDVPGQTVNRFCSSGLQTIATASNAIMVGEMDIVVAGGIERMSGMDMKNTDTEFQDPDLVAIKPGIYDTMGMTAEKVAKLWKICRGDMDKMAVESHAKAAAARKAGKFKDEIIPISVKTADGSKVLTEDEGIREGTNMEGLSQLKPCFKEDGIVTAATSSQMTDGASFVVLMAREVAKKLGYKPIAKFVTFAVAGVGADVMGIGPMKAVPKVLKKTGLKITDMDVIELNEAFASQALACIRELGMPYERVNPNGGAMALGHPMGATGSVLTCKALSELKRTGGKYGLVTMCIGGGMGAACVYELEK